MEMSCRWFTTNNNNNNCPLLTDRKVPIKKKKKDNTSTTEQPTDGYILPQHSGAPTWFSSESAVELITTTTNF